MLPREENELVTRVGPGTPLGNVMRRYWLPVCTTEQLPHPDCAPLRISLLGERFVAFRDSNGKVGVLDEMCMHRGASLALGRVEECGIRCLYHGWKFAVDGTVLETPNHADASLKSRLQAPAYPVREAGGLVWAYLGPKQKEPPFTRYRFMDAAPENRCVVRINVAASYLQLWEGGADSSHVGILHSDAARPGWIDKTFNVNRDALNPGAFESDDNAPRLDLENTDFGFHYAAIRQTGRVENGTAIENVRIVPLIMPFTRVIPSRATYYTIFEVPADDQSTSTFMVVDSSQPVDRDRVWTILGLEDERFYSKDECAFRATWANRLGQDRARMTRNWTGLRGLEQEDAVISLSMGPILDRSKEHLVAADRAVVRMRRRVLDNIKIVEGGGDPIGVQLADLTRVVALDANVAAGTRWQDLAQANMAIAAPRAKEPA
jgi:phenylpropionate dioxygenase-like ring-hydroxylating dioxygenase large terminal subunit